MSVRIALFKCHNISLLGLIVRVDVPKLGSAVHRIIGKGEKWSTRASPTVSKKYSPKTGFPTFAKCIGRHKKVSKISRLKGRR